MVLTKPLKSVQVIRAIQAITAGVQAGLGVLAGTEVLNPQTTVIVMALIAVSQVAVATWNSGLHNKPESSES